MKRILLVIIIFCLVYSLLNYKLLLDKSVNIPTNITQIQFSHGIENITPEIKYIEYRNEYLVIDYNFENYGKECSVGLVVFINGIAQKYKTTNNETVKTMHSFDLLKEKTKTVNLLIIPNTGIKDDELEMYIGVILNPDLELRSDPDFVFGNSHKLSQTLPLCVKYYRGSHFNINTEEESKFAITTICNNKVPVIKDNNEDLSFFVINNKCNVTKIKDNKTKVKLDIYPLITNTYRITFFINHIPVSINQNRYIDINLNSNEKTVLDLAITNINSTKKLNSFYAIAVPLSDLNASIEKSESVLLEISD